jgi:hypothetical protein
MRRSVFPTTASLPRRVIPLREKMLPKGNFAEESGFAVVASLAKGDRFAKEGNFGMKVNFAEDGVFDKESNFF